jgi:hypothetical protein
MEAAEEVLMKQILLEQLVRVAVAVVIVSQEWQAQ